ncbi:hypothetical protein [Scopulibacillus cellulosilyticus]|uniref:Uncharacterized protein n=1 Tax=Scopulibacillus cellulosilyticus TaxID=2665665 RepID=A0ABW2PVL6_9BACL
MSEIANLTNEQLNKITHMENELGVILVAYEDDKHSNKEDEYKNSLNNNGAGI